MTEAELEQWILIASWGPARSQRFEQFMRRFVSVPSSRDLILRWAYVMATARANGHRIESADAWVAATALLYGGAVVTHNAKDFVGIPDLVVDTCE
jgi:predicted nucleic acid-binding protein